MLLEANTSANAVLNVLSHSVAPSLTRTSAVTFIVRATGSQVPTTRRGHCRYSTHVGVA